MTNTRTFYIGIGDLTLADKEGKKLFRTLKRELLKQNQATNGYIYVDYFIPIQGTSCDIKVEHAQFTSFWNTPSIPVGDPNFTGTAVPPTGDNWYSSGWADDDAAKA